MKSFSSFCNEREDEKEKKVDPLEKNLREKYDELKDLDGDALTSKLYEEVKKQKDDGSFDYEALADGVERLRMFIPNESYQNMKSMLERLK